MNTLKNNMRKPLTEEQRKAKNKYNREYRKENLVKNSIKNSIRNKIWREANPEYHKKHYELNKEKYNNNSKLWANSNPEKIKIKNAKRSKESISKHNKKRYSSNPQKANEASKKWRKNNREKMRENNKNYTKKRNLIDPLFKLSGRVRNMINQSLKKNKYTKTSKTEKILGCSFESFKNHLESNFKSWMNWDNHGIYNGELNYGWDIDHIIPLSSAITEEELLKLCNFKNLQPLCSKTNRDIKKNKH